MEPNLSPPLDERTRNAKTLAHICYALHVLGPLLTIGMASLAGIIINYIKRPDSQGTFLYSHHDWMIRTFWWTLGWLVPIGLVTVLTLGAAMLVLWIPLVVLSVWYLYRMIKGWLRLNENRTVE